MTRAEALQVYIDEGPDVAARAAGVSVRTIYRWAATEGVSTTAISEKVAAATTAAKERAVLNRAEVRALLLEQTVKALHQMDDVDPKEKQALSMTVGILLDKYRLEAGEATSRGETRDITDSLNDHERELLRRAIQRQAAAEPAEEAAVVDSGEGQPTSPTG